MIAASGLSERAFGVVLVSASAAVFGLAGVLTKSISADPLTVNCWRGLVGGALVTAYVVWRRRAEHTPQPLRLGWPGWLIAVVGAAASVAFISAFKNTYVANVAIIYAIAPFIAAFLAWLIIGERARSLTMRAATLSLGGVAIMVLSGIGTGRPFGDGLALMMTCGSALYMVLIRKFRDTPVVWAGAVSSFLLFGLGWLISDPLAITARDGVLLVAFGASFALAQVMWTEGARLIPAAEAGLLGSAEVPFGIFFAWLFLDEIPPEASLIGGAIVLTAVCWHAGRDLRESRTQQAQPF